MQANSKEKFDHERVKAFVQSYIPEAHLKEEEVGDMVFMLPPFNSQNALAYRTLLSNLDSNLDALQLGCYGISDTTLEEVRNNYIFTNIHKQKKLMYTKHNCKHPFWCT